MALLPFPLLPGSPGAGPLRMASRISLEGMPFSIILAISSRADQAPAAKSPLVLPSLVLSLLGETASSRLELGPLPRLPLRPRPRERSKTVAGRPAGDLSCAHGGTAISPRCLKAGRLFGHNLTQNGHVVHSAGQTFTLVPVAQSVYIYILCCYPPQFMIKLLKSATVGLHARSAISK